MRLFCVLFITAISATNLIAADIGVIGSKMWTSDDDIGDPPGLGFFVTDRVSERFRLQLEYRYFRNERQVLGRIGPLPPPDTDPELITSVTTVNAYDADLLVEVWQVVGVGIQFGPGISVNSISRTMKGTDLNSTREKLSVSRFGLSFSTRVSTQPLSDSPLRLNLSFKAKRIVANKAHVLDSYSLYDDGIGVYELSIGFAYIFD